ncbi:MAG: hypothetical protein AAF829_06830 [Pseudomonadota bacterium]
MSRVFTGLATLAGLCLLASCNSGVGDAFDTRQNAGPCPSAASLYESARVVKLEEGENFGNITYTGEITDVRLFCRYVGGNPLEAQLELDFAFGKGPRGTQDEYIYTYWVAVTRRNGNVLAKERFATRADFSGSPIDAVRETISNIVIPRFDESISGANFEILVGFELTDEELQFNRDGKRFRLDAQSGRVAN